MFVSTWDQAEAGDRQALGQPPRVGMIFGQALDVVASA